CHVQGDFASDENPKKEVARKMISMVRLIDTSFPSSAGVFPDGYHEVDCSTCHRGNVKPETVAPSKFYNRGNSLGNPPPAQVPGTGVFPVGEQKVTCWTCHRGDPHPVSLANKAYPPPQPK